MIPGGAFNSIHCLFLFPCLLASFIIYFLISSHVPPLYPQPSWFTGAVAKFCYSRSCRERGDMLFVDRQSTSPFGEPIALEILTSVAHCSKDSMKRKNAGKLPIPEWLRRSLRGYAISLQYVVSKGCQLQWAGLKIMGKVKLMRFNIMCDECTLSDCWTTLQLLD